MNKLMYFSSGFSKKAWGGGNIGTTPITGISKFLSMFNVAGNNVINSPMSINWNDKNLYTNLQSISIGESYPYGGYQLPAGINSCVHLKGNIGNNSKIFTDIGELYITKNLYPYLNGINIELYPIQTGYFCKLFTATSELIYEAGIGDLNLLPISKRCFSASPVVGFKINPTKQLTAGGFSVSGKTTDNALYFNNDTEVFTIEKSTIFNSNLLYATNLDDVNIADEVSKPIFLGIDINNKIGKMVLPIVSSGVGHYKVVFVTGTQSYAIM